MTAQAILPSVKTSAYQHGIDFFIEKPLNIAEVKSVIKLAAQNINMSNRLLQVLDLVSGAATNNNTVTINGKNKKKKTLSPSYVFSVLQLEMALLQLINLLIR